MAKLNVTLPTGWSELTQAQLLDAYRAISRGFAAATVRMRLALMWANLRPVGCNSHNTYEPMQPSDKWLVEHGKECYELEDWQLQGLANTLEFIDTPPENEPAPLDTACGCERVDKLLSGVPFETYLMIENYFQGYLYTKNEDHLRECAKLMYPGLKDGFQKFVVSSTLYWLISLKACYARKFQHFFKPIKASARESGGQPAEVENAMNAQIRALTQGDITKEEQVMRADTLRALTELDAIARETEEIKAKYPNIEK